MAPACHSPSSAPTAVASLVVRQEPKSWLTEGSLAASSDSSQKPTPQRGTLSQKTVPQLGIVRPLPSKSDRAWTRYPRVWCP